MSTWSPISLLRERYPGLASEPDEKIAGYLAKPENFRAAIPEYAHLDDDTIKRNMAKVGREIGERAGAQPEKEGFLSHAGQWFKAQLPQSGTDVLRMMAGAVSPEFAARGAAESTVGEFKRAREAGHDVPYSTAAAANVPLGVSAERMEKAAEAGDPGGVLGEAAIPATLALGGIKEVREAAGKGSGAVKTALTRKPTAMTLTGRSPVAAMSTVKEAMSLPPKAVLGTESIFRAAAPTGAKSGFRVNLYVAAGDLNAIGQTLDWKAARGGIRNPDLRVRATVDAMNKYLADMYATERGPQIQRNAQNPIGLKFSTDAAEGLGFIERTAGKASDRVLAQKAATAPTMPLGELNDLAMTVNKELLSFEKMTAEQRATARVTSRRIGGLKELDRYLKNRLNEELMNRGEVGIDRYERRFAAISQLRDQLQSRMNAVELARSNVAGRIARATLGGKYGIASASQAAVADVNIGRMLEKGFQDLKASGIMPDKGTATPAPKVRGLLPSGAIPMPSRSAPIEPPSSQIPRTALGTRAERLGLLLPAEGGTSAPKITPQRGYSSNQVEKLAKLLEAKKTFGRDPKTGKFKRVYTTEPK